MEAGQDGESTTVINEALSIDISAAGGTNGGAGSVQDSYRIEKSDEDFAGKTLTISCGNGGDGGTGSGHTGAAGPPGYVEIWVW